MELLLQVYRLCYLDLGTRDVTLVATIRQSLKAPTLSPDSNILDRNYTCESEVKNIRILAWNRMLDTLSHCHLNSEDLKGKRTKQQ